MRVVLAKIAACIADIGRCVVWEVEEKFPEGEKVDRATLAQRVVH